MEMAMHENDRSLSVNIDVLLAQLSTLIADARKEAKRTVDVIQVRTSWEIGFILLFQFTTQCVAN